MFVVSFTKNQWERRPRSTSSDEWVMRYVIVGADGWRVNEKNGRVDGSVFRNGWM